ncbi:MAG: tetratricopeptide repeat protein [Verrucomicrobiota bacterium]
MKTMISLAAFATILLPLHAAENLTGAEAVLNHLASDRQAAARTGQAPENPWTAFRNDGAVFQKEVANMADEQAAKGWLALVDRWFALQDQVNPSDQIGRRSARFTEVLDLLPPPRTWQIISKEIDQRPKSSGKNSVRLTLLQMAGHLLVGDEAAVWKDLALLEKLQKEEDDVGGSVAFLGQIADALLDQEFNPDRALEAFELQLKAVEAGENPRFGTFEVPDLVTLAGAEKAEALLRRLLVLPESRWSIEAGNPTRLLARKIALQLIQQLKTPPWHLTLGIDPDSVKLYEQLSTRFPPSIEEPASEADENDPKRLARRLARQPDYPGDERSHAEAFYFLGLIASGRTSEAMSLATKWHKERVDLPTDGLLALKRAGVTRPLRDFLHELLSKQPELSLWYDYIEVATETGQTDEMVALVRAALSREGLSEKRRTELRGQLYLALLAADKVEEGVAEIKKVLADTLGETNEEETSRLFRHHSLLQNSLRRWQHYSRRNQSSESLRLAQLGSLLHRPEWIEEGLRAMRAQTNRMDVFLDSEWVELLAETGRMRDAEELITRLLLRVQTSESAMLGAMQGLFGGRIGGWTEAGRLLTQLAGLYHRAGQHREVLVLLERAPQWGIRDLADLRQQHDRGRVPLEVPLEVMAAAALLHAGRNVEARAILDHALNQFPDFDPAYELLVKLDGQNAIQKLEALSALDAFEERPLIWKAELLRQAGKLEEAETIIRTAIAIDPSDGEQPQGHRLKAYAVLAEIRDARGDVAQANIFRGAVKAIRLAESADRFYEAGLLSRAVKMYQESLRQFADAYCIQSRVAVQLTELGQHEKAAEHYRRAFELMPESFGRIETHCFGCEGVFSGLQAGTIAEKVFQELVQKMPDKPQLHYLLGYLREEQDRFAEALSHYRQAVRLDANYLNAWKQIESLADRVPMNPSERAEATLNLLRLDPLQRHSSPAIARIKDLKALWEAVAAATRQQPKSNPKIVFPLVASAAELERKEQAQRELRAQMGIKAEADEQMETYFRFFTNPEKMTPAQVIAQNDVLRTISNTLDYQFMNRRF